MLIPFRLHWRHRCSVITKDPLFFLSCVSFLLFHCPNKICIHFASL